MIIAQSVHPCSHRIAVMRMNVMACTFYIPIERDMATKK